MKTIIAIAILLSSNHYNTYSVIYNGDLYEYSAYYASDEIIGDNTDTNFIIDKYGDIVYVKDIINN